MSGRRQNGSGLIEALISIFVVSIAFLGFAGLQINGLAAANESLFRSKAVYLSYQMADRVRANLPGAAAGAYNNFTSQVVPSPGCTITVNCTAAQMAINDFAEWLTEVQTPSVLPSGAGVVCLTTQTGLDATPDSPECDGGGNVLAIKLWWVEKGQRHQFVSTFRP
ncbi:MAG TPA: type IV pilus modification protein PilV [Casimicrobiaceae bacterium]|nr:type IV pilus modification protein PilV [Casimicrobiaceae bacterium]